VNSNELSLEVAKSHNLKTMRLVDTSKYCDDIIVENYLIEVLPVNKTTWSTFHVQKGFSLTLNSSNLGYRKVDNSADLADIPDGIYEFKQSHKPNVHTMVRFYHLRTVALNLKYVELLCSHLSNVCSVDAKVYEKETIHLMKIKQYIDAAEYSVSEQHNKTKGIEFYNKAISLIKEYEKVCGCK
jgi:hypothetical protein